MTKRPTFAWKVAVLSSLYFVQGLPYGFQATALPVYLRARGLSLTGISLLSILAVPWMLKALWAPLVDRWGSERFGKRRSWIVPMQIGLAATAGAAAFIPLPAGVPVLLGAVLLMNFFAATMDIAVDGLAIDLLDESELGHGNSIQVNGYKVGMLTGGGLLVWASKDIGWSGLLAAMAVLTLLVTAFTLTWREPPQREVEAGDPTSIADVMKAAAATLKVPGAVWVLAFVATYKLGESMIDAMYKPLLVDLGFDAPTLGAWLGTWGMLASLAGSAAGGFLASRLPIVTALGLASFLRVGPLVGEWWVATGHASRPLVFAITQAEHFFGGALTVVLFAFMMARVDRRIGATHYTLLATIEVLGKSPGTWASGPMAQRLGYGPVFATGVVLSLLFLLLLVPVARSSPPDVGPA
jgi:MFS family permease